MTVFMPIPGVVINIEDPPSLDAHEEVAVYLAYKEPKAGLDALGRALDAHEIDLETAQGILLEIAPNHRLETLAQDFRPKWWQRSGWKGVLGRFAKTYF